MSRVVSSLSLLTIVWLISGIFWNVSVSAHSISKPKQSESDSQFEVGSSNAIQDSPEMDQSSLRWLNSGQLSSQFYSQDDYSEDYSTTPLDVRGKKHIWPANILFRGGSGSGSGRQDHRRGNGDRRGKKYVPSSPYKINSR